MFGLQFSHIDWLKISNTLKNGAKLSLVQLLWPQQSQCICSGRFYGCGRPIWYFNFRVAEIGWIHNFHFIHFNTLSHPVRTRTHKLLTLNFKIPRQYLFVLICIDNSNVLLSLASQMAQHLGKFCPLILDMIELKCSLMKRKYHIQELATDYFKESTIGDNNLLCFIHCNWLILFFIVVPCIFLR